MVLLFIRQSLHRKLFKILQIFLRPSYQSALIDRYCSYTVTYSTLLLLVFFLLSWLSTTSSFLSVNCILIVLEHAVISYCLLSGFEFRIFLLLYWLPTKTRKQNLSCYLTYSWVGNTNFFSFILNLACQFHFLHYWPLAHCTLFQKGNVC